MPIRSCQEIVTKTTKKKVIVITKKKVTKIVSCECDEPVSDNPPPPPTYGVIGDRLLAELFGKS